MENITAERIKSNMPINENEVLYIKNPRYEFVQDENSMLVFDEHVDNIYRMNKSGKMIVNFFENPTTLVDAIKHIQNMFVDVLMCELEEYIAELTEEKIIIPVL